MNSSNQNYKLNVIRKESENLLFRKSGSLNFCKHRHRKGVCDLRSWSHEKDSRIIKVCPSGIKTPQVGTKDKIKTICDSKITNVRSSIMN